MQSSSSYVVQQCFGLADEATGTLRRWVRRHERDHAPDL
jgi:hypothetical protein